MSLQMIYGRAHSGKSKYISDKICELTAEGKKLILVVPEQFTHLAEKRLIASLGSISTETAEILSFNTMAKRINSLYPNNKKRLNSIAKALIMSEIISETELLYYKNTSAESGLCDMFIDEISEFKKYNISAEDAMRASDMASDKGLSMKLSDLAKVYRAYDDAISKEYSDSDDALGILADNLKKFKPYSGYTVFFDEFSSFNPVEKDIISSLVLGCEDVYMAFTADTDERYKYLFKPCLDTASGIIEKCLSIGCRVNPPIVLKDTYYDNAEMDFLEKNIYAYPNGEYESAPSNIRIYSSENPYSEIALLASQIKSLVRDKNIRYRDISVVCTDTDAYAHVFRSVFSDFDIPYFLDEKTPVLKHSIICFVLSVIDVYLHGYNSESVIAFLKSGHIDADRNSVIDIDNFITATNISKNTWLDDDRWNAVADKYCRDDARLYNSLNLIRDKYILPLASLHDSIKGRNTVKFISEKLYRYFTDSGFDKNVSDFISYFNDISDKHMAKQYEAVWKILIEAMDMLVFVMGDKDVNLREYKSYLYTAFSKQQIGAIPTSLDLIIISDLMRSKTEFASYQFIVGACDGIFPAPDRDNAVIGDSDKQKLSELGIELSPSSRDKAYFERFLIYSAITHADKSLIISYPASDTSFSALRPSFTITLIKNIFPKLTVRTNSGSDESIMLSNKSYAMEYLAMSSHLSSQDAHSGGDIYSYLKDNDPTSLDTVRKYLKPNPSCTRLDTELSERLFKDGFYSTVSRIQRYNSCRYSYYLDYMLKLKDKKTSDTDSADVGNFVHAVIEQSFKKMNADCKDISKADEAYFAEMTADIFEENLPLLFPYQDELDASKRYRLSVIKKSVLNSLMQIKNHLANSAFQPIGHEIVFDDDNVGCISLNLDNGKKLKLTGKIDRADYFENENGRYIRVIDYKTGNKTFSLSEIYHGLDLQLIVYLNALVKGTPHAHHAGALYFRIQNPLAELKSHPDGDALLYEKNKANAMSGIIADDEFCLNAYDSITADIAKKASLGQFRLLSDYVEDSIKRSAVSLSEGRIDINPYSLSSKSPCTYCSYRSVCGLRESDCDKIRSLDNMRDNKLWEAILKKGEGGGR